VGISFLIFTAKILASLSSRFKVPEVVGEVLAGIIFGHLSLAVIGSFFWVYSLAIFEMNYLIFMILFKVAVFSKVVGCDLPATILFNIFGKGLCCGMVSMCEWVRI
jgi:NhaP-type Na+/H+ or K+/H+ antiporter